MVQPIRFYTDEHVPRAVIRGLRQRGVNVMTVPEVGLLGATDEEHLATAKDQTRVLVTRDEDFLKLHVISPDHAGIAMVPHGMSIGDTIRGLMLIYQLLTVEEMMGHLEYL